MRDKQTRMDGWMWMEMKASGGIMQVETKKERGTTRRKERRIDTTNRTKTSRERGQWKITKTTTTVDKGETDEKEEEETRNPNEETIHEEAAMKIQGEADQDRAKQNT